MTETNGNLVKKDKLSLLITGWVFVLTGIIGAIASFMLLYERVQLWENPNHSTACDINPWVSCGAVMESWQAATFGFPNIFIGVVAFPLLILTGVLLVLLNKQFQFLSKLKRKVLWSGILAGSLFAFGFVTWLWYSAVFQIGVLCPYCMVVWAAVIPFTVITISYIINNNVFSLNISNKVKNITKQWWWVTVFLLYLSVILSIIIKFPYAF